MDERDLIDVMDPVRRIAAQAMMQLNVSLPHEKPNQEEQKKVKEFTQTFVKVIEDMPESNFITKKKLSDTVEKAGNRSSNSNEMYPLFSLVFMT